MVTTNGAADSSSELSSWPTVGSVSRNEFTVPNSTQPPMTPLRVQPPKITAAMAMNPCPPTMDSSNRPTWPSTR